MNRIVPASEDEVFSITGRVNASIPFAKLMYRGQRVVALGGFAKRPGDERVWAWLDCVPLMDIEGIKLIRAVRAALHEANRTVHLQCEGEQAQRFLRLLGFEPTGETELDHRTGTTFKEVWVWHHWPL